MSEFKFELGAAVKDVVSGFKGVVMARYQYTTGCNQYGVSPRKLDKEGKVRGWATFDENRLEIASGKKLVLDSVSSTKGKIKGGPQRGY